MTLEAGPALLAASPTPVGGPSSNARDRRLDLLRGFALLAVFIDHVPGNALTLLTLRTHAVSDAADVFVFLAGYSAWLAYGRTFERGRMWAGFRRVLARCGRIYAMQAAMLVTCFAIASTWVQLAGLEPGPVLRAGGAGLARTLILYAQPGYFNVLPLYICLLLAFPIIWAGLRWRPRTTLLASAGLWLLVNFNPGLNLPQWIGRGGWAFNPFEWQFLFVLGAAAAAANTTWQRPLRRTPLITLICWIFLGEMWLALRYYAWYPSSVPVSHLAGSGDMFPHLLRLLSGLAIIYLALTSERFAWLVRSSRLLAIEVCGRHSLAVFGLGSVLSMLGRFTFRTVGDGVLPQVMVNGVGIIMLVAAADLLEHKRQGEGGLKLKAGADPSRKSSRKLLQA